MLKVLLLLGLLVPALAGAHVKWFAASWDPAAAPIGLVELLGSPAFVALFALALLVVAGARSIDGRLAARRALRRFLAGIELKTSGRLPQILRFGLAAYFVSIALYFHAEPILLTPELKAGFWWMPMVQLGIALGLLFRSGVIPACMLIALLYGRAAHVYGWVHMLDYHYFLGVIVLLLLDAWYGQRRAELGLLVLRITVATSFMWVAAEKWLYPHWTHEILSQLLPPVLGSFDVHFSCTAAGFVEFALAFFILFGMAASQIAALVLLSLLLAAIPFVGPVDAIGHLPLVVALAILALTRNRWMRSRGAKRVPITGTFLFPFSLVALLMLYFFSHELGVLAPGFGSWPATVSHVAFASAAAYGVTYLFVGWAQSSRCS